LAVGASAEAGVGTLEELEVVVVVELEHPFNSNTIGTRARTNERMDVIFTLYI
jgi:hypothetical protein